MRINFALIFLSVSISPTNAQNNLLIGASNFGGEGKGMLYCFDIIEDEIVQTSYVEVSNPGFDLFKSNLTSSANGRLYGALSNGGGLGRGVLFEYRPNMNKYSSLMDFGSEEIGYNPRGSLTYADNGKIFGITYSGGTFEGGVLYEYDFTNGKNKALYNFSYNYTGNHCYIGLVESPLGNIYGITEINSHVFEYNPSTDSIKLIYKFSEPYLRCVANDPTFVTEQDMLFFSRLGNPDNGDFVLCNLNVTSGVIDTLILLDNIGSGTQISKFVKGNTDYYFTITSNLPSYNAIYKYSVLNNMISTVEELPFTNTANHIFKYSNKLHILTNSDADQIYSYDLSTSEFLNTKYFYYTGASTPQGGLTYLNGKLWGVTRFGGLTNNGIIYAYNLLSDSIENRLSLNYSTKENTFNGPVTQSEDGRIFGTTKHSFAQNWKGTIYEYDFINNKRKILFELDETNGYRINHLTSQGNKLYGFTDGGNFSDNSYKLVEYNYTLNQLTPRVEFKDSLGEKPTAGLLKINSNQLIGVTEKGGVYDKGVLFRYNRLSNQYDILHHFYNNLITEGTKSNLVEYGSNFFIGIASGGTNNKGVIYTYDLVLDSLSIICDFGQYSDLKFESNYLVEADNESIYGYCNNQAKTKLFEYDLMLDSLTVIDINFWSTGNLGALIHDSVRSRIFGTSQIALFEYDYYNDSIINKSFFDGYNGSGFGPGLTLINSEIISSTNNSAKNFNNSINVFPNPCDKKVSINLDNESIYQVQLSGIDGQLYRIESVGLASSVELDLSALTNGTYLVVVFSTTNVYEKIITVVH